MSIFEAAASAIAELVAYVISRAVGRTFHLSPKRAQVIGEYVVIGPFVGAVVLVALLYS